MSVSSDFAAIRARAQALGWTVEHTRGGRWLFRNTAGQTCITSENPDDRTLIAIRGDLRRMGFIPYTPKRKTAPVERKETTTMATENDSVLVRRTAQALDTAIEMLNEMASEFAAYRKATDARIAALEKRAVPDTQSFVTATMLHRESERLQSLITEASNKADPLGAFRAQLRGA